MNDMWDVPGTGDISDDTPQHTQLYAALSAMESAPLQCQEP